MTPDRIAVRAAISKLRCCAEELLTAAAILQNALEDGREDWGICAAPEPKEE
jgi:hypothetical protein